MMYILENVEVAAGSVIGGFTRLEYNAYIGINAIVCNMFRIGKNSVIEMGSTVTKNVESDTVVAGNPARLFVKRE